VAAFLGLGIFFALLQADWALPLGPLTVFHTELALAFLMPLALAAPSRAGLRPWLLAFSPLGIWLLAHAALGPGGPWEGIKGLLRAAEFAAALALPALLIRDKRALGLVLRTVFFTACLGSLWAIAQSVAGPGAPLNQGREIEVIWGFQAAAAGMGHHNQLGAFLAALLCLAWASWHSGLERPWALAALILGAAALLASYSRGAWVGAAAAGAVLVFLAPWRWRLALIGCGILLLLAGYFGPSEAFRTRLQGLGGDSDRAAHLRLAWGLWEGHQLWGWGTANLEIQLKSVAESLPLGAEARRAFSSHLHNSYLQQGLEWGAPVLLAWLLFFLKPLGEAWARRRSPFALALAAAMLAFFLQAATDLVTLHARGMAIAFCWGLMLAGLRAVPALEKPRARRL
jgi:putative inorganic carbon (HCO3(-)) transporter